MEQREPVSGAVCRNGHVLVLVPREVRRLEKDSVWSCDSSTCKYTWGEAQGMFMDRQRYRCVHYMSGGKCNYDLCGDCFSANKPEEKRRSSREPKPKFNGGRDGEWLISPKYQIKSEKHNSPSSKHSPRSAIVSPKRTGRKGRSGSGSRSPRSALGRSTRSRRSSGSPITAAGRSPRGSARENGKLNHPDESESESEEENLKRVESPPFYPSAAHHVRFSPSVKNGSPFGRKTRSGRRGMSSYLQSLPSEDEQSEFNRLYTRDLRKRQARKLSEEGAEEEEPYSRRRKDRGRVSLAETYDENTEEDTPVRSRRKPRARAIASEGSEDEEEEEGEGAEAEPTPRRNTRRVSESQSEHEAHPAKPSTRGRPKKGEAESEEDQPLASRKKSLRAKKEKIEDNTEDEDEADPTVTEAAVRKGRTRRRPAEDADADTESGAEKVDEVETEDSDEFEEEQEEEGTRRTSRRTRAPVKRFNYGDAPVEQTRGNSKLMNMDKYCSEDEFNGCASPKKKKYSLRKKRANTTRYQDEFPANDDKNSKDQGLIRRSAMGRENGFSSRSRNDRSRGRGGRSRRQRTGESSSSASCSSSSDEEAFDRRKTKRMLIEREKLRPLNMNKKDVTKSIFKERAKVGSSLADVQPMEMDMGVTFDSIGGMKEYVNSLKEMVMFPLLYPELFNQFKIVPPRGVLFYGPPGTGKTLLARALACECSTENRKVAFFMRKGADCLSKWIGESERQLRLLFDQAYQMRPSIIFFDEIDGLAPVRSSRQDQIHSSIVSTLLALMDGLDNRGDIIVIGATNRIENIDPALRRPGRFDRELRFSLPTRSTRKEILKLHTKEWNPPISPQLMNFLASKTLGYCGADIKGLCAESALNALRRRYPQVYESSQKLQIDLNQVVVLREDFDKALRKIVPSTHRVEDKILSPLPRHMKALLEPTYLNIVANIKRIFPHSGMGKGALIPPSLTHRPRLMIVGSEGQGQTTYIGPALLHFMEKFPCQKLDIPALFSNSARTPEEACNQIIHSARRTMPGILYIPHLCLLWDTISETVRATLTTLLTDIPPTAPLLILAVSNQPYSTLPLELQGMFLPYYREVYKLENPGENERREYFRPLIVSCSALPPKPAPIPEPVESLPVLAEPECRKLTAREEKRLLKKEEHLLRELRIFLRDIWAKINRESKFFMFRVPVNTDEVDDYLHYVRNPMDFEKMHIKLDDGDYKCAQDFLNDIDLIASNATAYNCDLAYETNRIICHRARALQDFAYALVKSEMDTDFEDECKEIVERRTKVTSKLKKMDKENPELVPSPSKMQDMMAIVSTRCEICKSREDDGNMLLCDGCDHGYHTYCTKPTITEVPEGDWFCVKCLDAGLDKTHDLDPETGETPTEGGSGGARKKKRKRSKWASGVASSGKKKVPKKKIFDSDVEKEGKEEKEEEEGKDEEKDEPMEEEEDEGVEERGEKEKGSKIDLDSSSINLVKKLTVESVSPVTGEELEPVALAPVREETPSQPTGVRIDGNKLMAVHNEVVRVTEGFTVEKLERTYAILAKVVRLYKTQFDRTNLPTDLQAELDGIKQQDRLSEHTNRIRR